MLWKSAGEGSGEGVGSLSAGKGCGGKVGSAREVPGGRRVKKGREGEIWEAGGGGEEGGNENYEVLNKTFWRNN
jgi:hypothetical protein